MEERRMRRVSMSTAVRAVVLVSLVVAAGCGGGGDGEAEVAADAAESTSTSTTAEAREWAEASVGDPADVPDGEGDVVAVEVGESEVDPRAEVADPCELLDVDAASDVLGAVGDTVELEGGAACGLESESGERVALGVVRSDGTAFLTPEQAGRGVALDDPGGAVWVTSAPVEESDVLVVEVGRFADLVVEVSAGDRPESERRAMAVSVARTAIARYEEVERP